MTHVLLTRSPLSPVPKDWFSLDLHVLSAPPAFVLSQDQTLREDECRSEDRRSFHFELVLKVRLSPKREARQGLVTSPDRKASGTSVST